MIIRDRYKLTQVMLLPSHNKVWGRVELSNSSTIIEPDIIRVSVYPKSRYNWCWWAEIGKNLSIKRHMNSYYRMMEVDKKKMKNNYIVITPEELLDRWPDFPEKLELRMIYEALANGE